MALDIYERVWMVTSSNYKEGIQELKKLYSTLMAEPCKCVSSDDYDEYIEMVRNHIKEGDRMWVVRNSFKGNPKSFECARCNGLSQIWDLIKGE